MSGGEPGGAGYTPLRCSRSAPFRPAPRTRTRISPAPGSGSGCSSTTTSPSRIVAARMARSVCVRRRALHRWRCPPRPTGSRTSRRRPTSTRPTAPRPPRSRRCPMLDGVVRKLIELGYERALRQTYLGSSVRLGQDQLPRIWVPRARGLPRRSTCADVPDLYLTQFPIANALTIGTGKPIIVLNSELVQLLDERRAARRHRPRGGAHPLRPRPLPDGADDPPAARDRGPPADRSPACRCVAVRMRAARVVARRRAVLRPRRGARHPRPDRRLPHADGVVRRRGGRRAEPRRVPRSRGSTTTRAARGSSAPRGCSCSCNVDPRDARARASTSC